MKKIFTRIITFFGSKKMAENSDFSEFFGKSSGDKKKVMGQILREANEEQRKVVDEYRKQLNRV